MYKKKSTLTQFPGRRSSKIWIEKKAEANTDHKLLQYFLLERASAQTSTSSPTPPAEQKKNVKNYSFVSPFYQSEQKNQITNLRTLPCKLGNGLSIVPFEESTRKSAKTLALLNTNVIYFLHHSVKTHLDPKLLKLEHIRHRFKFFFSKIARQTNMLTLEITTERRLTSSEWGTNLYYQKFQKNKKD